jgi:alpha-tubulin suppressor-like RCC1 family protein
MHYNRRLCAAGGAILLGIDCLAASMTNNSATLNGAINPNGLATTAWFEWGLGSRFDQKTISMFLGSDVSIVAFNTSLGGLTPGMTHRFRIVVSNSVGVVTRGIESALLSPRVTLNGADPLTNQWGLAFVDPGLTASGAPVSLAGGRVHSFALKADGTVAGWGDGSVAQTNVPPSATNLIALASGQNHGVAARANGTVVAWGENLSGQTNVAASATNVLAVAAGESCCLALRTNGTIVGWGDSFYGQTIAPVTATNTIAIAAGQRHCLALKNDGTIIAWGYNGFAQTNVPATATNVVAIAAGAGHSLALRADGAVIAWGLNSYNQTNVPANATNVTAIAAGYYHCLALRADGTVIAWGAGMVNGATPHHGQAMVPPDATNVTTIAAGYYHSLALQGDGNLIAWGAGTKNLGAFPSLGQATVPPGLNALSLPVFVSGAVVTNLPGNYPLAYTVTNAFGGVGTTARNVVVTRPPPAPNLDSLTVLGSGAFQFSFTNATPIHFTVVATTNVLLPLTNWTVLGAATQISSGIFQFTDPQATNFPRRFYQVRSP